MADERRGNSGGRRAVLLVGALGVVFGDIGTSPLYAMQTVFSPDALRPVPVEETAIYGAISLVFWSITVIVTAMYVLTFMRTDNDGEGGMLALLALLAESRLSAKAFGVLASVGIFGAALFFGDSMITPAISVLSSMEGLEILDPGLKEIVVPGAVGILLALFAVQRWGTARVGRFFGPIMALWFVAIAAVGVPEIVRHPDVLQALSPHWALRFFLEEPLIAFLALGGVVLAFTGAVALYADMGHFGRKPISRSWLAIVFPALTLNYLGQGALLVSEPSAVSNPFFLLVPDWALMPMVALATLATVIASQAVISGAYSVAHQAARLGFLPRLRVVHTSAREQGQIYMPFVNWLLMIAVLALVLVFQSSEKLAAAYGVAVIGTITVTTTLFFTLQWVRDRRPHWQVAGVGALFLFFVLVFLAANLVKIGEGGYLPVGIGLVIFTVLTTWRRGRKLADASRDQVEGSLQEFVNELHNHEIPVRRVPGCAVFLSRGEGSTPLALRANVEHNHTLHKHTVVLTLESLRTPRTDDETRVTVDDLGFSDDGITHVTARVGYLEKMSLPAVLRRAREIGLEGGEADVDEASYFVSAPELRVTDALGMAKWRKHLFVATTRLTSDPVEFFDLPRGNTVVMGAEIDL